MGARMQRTLAVLGSALFFVIVPCTMAGLVPWWITHWQFQPALFGMAPTRLVGGVLILLAVPGLVDSFARFALQGLGTPAPIAPTRHLVVTGLYRHVRNPMYVAVASAIFGQAILFADWRLVLYGALFWLASSCLRRGLRRTDARADLRRRICDASAPMFRAGFRG